MGRADILNGIYTTLRANTTILNLLGTVSAGNRRIYRAFPQTSPTLSTVEPAGEGWMVLQELSEMPTVQSEQLVTIHEVLDVQVHLFVTALSLAQRVLDEVDATYHWRLEQQRAIQYGEHILLNSRRFATTEKYNQATKLYEVLTAYRLTLVQETATA